MDEGVPSETEEDRRLQENRAKEIRGDHPRLLLYCILFYSPNYVLALVSFIHSCFIPEILRRKDEQIISLLEEKVHIFRELGDCNIAPDDINPPVKERMLFRATPDDVTKGEPIIKDALKECEQGSEIKS